MIGYWALIPHSKKGFKPKDLGSFDWEKTTVDDLAEKIRKYRENKKRLQEKKNG